MTSVTDHVCSWCVLVSAIPAGCTWPEVSPEDFRWDAWQLAFGLVAFEPIDVSCYFIFIFILLRC